MFNKQSAVFLQSRAAKASDFRSDKTRAACLLKGFKDISGKVYLNGFDNHDALVNFGNTNTNEKNVTYEIIMQENQISHVFRNFTVYERHHF